MIALTELLFDSRRSAGERLVARVCITKKLHTTVPLVVAQCPVNRGPLFVQDPGFCAKPAAADKYAAKDTYRGALFDCVYRGFIAGWEAHASQG